MGEGIRIGGGAKKEGLYVWKKLTAEGGDFIDFVVSNSETAYPDGGTQDGYWYEKVVEGVSGIDYGEVTLSAAATSVTIEHNLGVAPRYAALFSLNGTAVGTHASLQLGNYTIGTAYLSGAFPLKSAFVQYANYNKVTRTVTQCKFPSFTSTDKLVKGKYMWVAIA